MSPAQARAALACTAALFALPCAAQPTGPGEDAQRKAAWQIAVLAERMGKLHAQSGQGLVVERARRGLAEATGQFEALLRQSPAAAPTAEARDNYLLLALLWREYRPWIARAATRENARRIAERTEELAWIALKAARMAQARAGGAAAAGDAARACVLAQRVARLLLLRRWEIRDDAATRQLQTAAHELRSILERLRALPGNSAEVGAELQVAQNQHAFLEQAAGELATKPAAHRALEVAAKTGDNILESMQRVARLYENDALSASAPR